MFTRILVGTDGSDTATEAVRQAVELSGAALEIVSAYEPIPNQRVRAEQREAPEDVQHGIGPRET